MVAEELTLAPALSKAPSQQVDANGAADSPRDRRSVQWSEDNLASNRRATEAASAPPESLGVKQEKTLKLPEVVSRRFAPSDVASDFYDKNFLEGFLNDGFEDFGRKDKNPGKLPMICSGSTLKSRARTGLLRSRTVDTAKPASPGPGSESPHSAYFRRLRTPTTPSQGSPSRKRTQGRLRETSPSSRMQRTWTEDTEASEVTAKTSVQAGGHHERHDRAHGGHTHKGGVFQRQSSSEFEKRRSKLLEMEQTLPPKMREACESLRMLVFGCIGNEDLQGAEKNKIFLQGCGTMEQIRVLMELWVQMDDDDSGDVDLNEFLEYFSKKKSDRLLGMRCVRYLVGSHVVDQDDESKVQSCTKEDMMRIIWPRATHDDIDYMNRLFDMQRLAGLSVAAPPLLSRRRRRELLENFQHLKKQSQKKGDGNVKYADLVDAGLVDYETAEELRLQYDRDQDGTLDCEEFVEMLCPYGYRADENVTKAIDHTGRVLVLATMGSGSTCFHGWMHEDTYLQMKDDYRLRIADPKVDEDGDTPQCLS